MLTDEVPFKLNEINPLDTTMWRKSWSTPFLSDFDDATWTNENPINVANVPHLEDVYAKLNETTKYKNALVKKLMDLHIEQEALKNQMRDWLGSSNTDQGNQHEENE